MTVSSLATSDATRRCFCHDIALAAFRITLVFAGSACFDIWRCEISRSFEATQASRVGPKKDETFICQPSSNDISMSSSSMRHAGDDAKRHVSALARYISSRRFLRSDLVVDAAYRQAMIDDILCQYAYDGDDYCVTAMILISLFAVRKRRQLLASPSA